MHLIILVWAPLLWFYYWGNCHKYFYISNDLHFNHHISFDVNFNEKFPNCPPGLALFWYIYIFLFLCLSSYFFIRKRNFSIINNTILTFLWNSPQHVVNKCEYIISKFKCKTMGDTSTDLNLVLLYMFYVSLICSLYFT